jgi:hypothetical protein
MVGEGGYNNMAGQSSQLSLSEARAMQERVQCSGSHACNNGGGRKSSMSSMKKMPKKSMKHEEMKMEKE